MMVLREKSKAKMPTGISPSEIRIMSNPAITRWKILKQQDESKELKVQILAVIRFGS